MGESRLPWNHTTVRRPLNAIEFTERARIEATRVNRYGGELGLILFSADNLSEVRERVGQENCEEVLENLGLHLSRRIRLHDLLGHLGDGDFAVLAPVMNLTEVTGFAVKLRHLVNEYQINGASFLRASFGVTAFLRGESLEAFERRARRALANARDAGGNRVNAARGEK